MTDDADEPEDKGRPYRGKGEECGWCRFCDDEGVCRRRAPVPRLTPNADDDGDRYPVWPKVAYYDWCGEFEGWTSDEMEARATDPRCRR